MIRLATLLIAGLLLTTAAARESALEIDILDDFLGQYDVVDGLEHCARWPGVHSLYGLPDPGSTPGTNDWLDAHWEWHSTMEGINAPSSWVGNHGEEFVLYHRGILDEFETWRNASGHAPIPVWDPAKPLPAEFAYDVPRACQPRETTDPQIQLPSYYTVAGGTEEHPVTGATNLCDFLTLNSLGWGLVDPYHNGAHDLIGGDMALPHVSPRDPAFFAWHKHIDSIAVTWESACVTDTQSGNETTDSAPEKKSPGVGVGGVLVLLALLRRR